MQKTTLLIALAVAGQLTTSMARAAEKSTPTETVHILCSSHNDLGWRGTPEHHLGVQRGVIRQALARLAAARTDLLENEAAPLPWRQGELQLPLQPAGIQTIRFN